MMVLGPCHPLLALGIWDRPTGPGCPYGSRKTEQHVSMCVAGYYTTRTEKDRRRAMIACVDGVAPSQGVGLVTFDPSTQEASCFTARVQLPFLAFFLPTTWLLLSRSDGTMLPSAGTHILHGRWQKLHAETQKYHTRRIQAPEASKIQRWQWHGMACVYHVALA